MPFLHHHSDAGIPCTSRATTFALFSQLPQEIATQILLLACRSSSSLLLPDVRTTHSLTLVSRSANALATPLLYRTVRITRPSCLVELVDTLEERPDLGQLVKHLHAGAEGTLVPGDWPLTLRNKEEGGKSLWLQTSLAGKEEEKLPKWCEPERVWALENGGEGGDHRVAAVEGAIQAALNTLDVHLSKVAYGRSGSMIGLSEWAVRLFLLQACLDLYLVDMRRIEDARSGDNFAAPPQGHYPCLFLSRNKENIKPQPGTLTLTTAHLWKHLTRRGASLDQFNHPIKFAGNIEAGHLNEYGTQLIQEDLRGPHAAYFALEYELQRIATASSGGGGAGSGGEEAQGAASWIPNDGDPASDVRGKTSNHKEVTTYTVTGIMCTTATLLDLTPNLVNLSLNGFLHLAFLMMDLDAMEKIKHLSLGPLLPFWDGGVFSEGQYGPLFRNLESLRVAGRMLVEEEAWRIAGVGKGLLKLKRFQWEMVQSTQPTKRSLLFIEGVYDLICALQGQEHVNSDDDDDDDELEEMDEHHSSYEGPPPDLPRLIEVALHPKNRADLLNFAPPATRAAWQAGTLLAGEKGKASAPHRVRLVESEAAKTDPSAHRSVAIERMHEEARRWWEACGVAEEEKTERGENWMPGRGRAEPEGA